MLMPRVHASFLLKLQTLVTSMPPPENLLSPCRSTVMVSYGAAAIVAGTGRQPTEGGREGGGLLWFEVGN